MSTSVVTGSPLVSVVIPSHNRRHYACVAVESVLRQTYHRLEVILVDDASDDGTAELVRDRFGAAVTVVESACNIERGAARNVGAANARGELLAFLDSDDVWLRTKLEKQLAARRTSSVAGVTGLFVIDGESRPTGRTYSPPRTAYAELVTRNPYLGAPSSILIDRGTFDAVGGFPEDGLVQGSEDWILLNKLRAHGVAIEVLRETLIGYRVHPSNSTGDIETVARSMWEAARWMDRELPEHASPRRDLETARLLVPKFAAARDFARARDWLGIARSLGEPSERIALYTWALLSVILRRPVSWPPALPPQVSRGYGWTRSERQRRSGLPPR